MRSAREVVHEMIEALNAHDVDAARALVAANAVDHTPVPGQAPGVEGWQAKWQMLGGAFPDATFTIEQSVELDGTVASRYTFRGTHKGEFMGMPPTGRTVSVVALDMIVVRDGLVAEHWGLFDTPTLMAQLGVAG